MVLNHARELLIVDAAEAGNRLSLIDKAVYLVSGLGHEAVMVFFVLSGFWITRAVDRRKDDKVFWRPYLTDRLSRLMIVLLQTCCSADCLMHGASRRVLCTIRELVRQRVYLRPVIATYVSLASYALYAIHDSILMAIIAAALLVSADRGQDASATGVDHPASRVLRAAPG
ncbi:hypothetical protein [Croceicoccus sediminis]|uniref:hypothetical protein n=1 Tax=Croceicoccus sediminis TaxID=2571150 RepID=UPI001181DA06|nr:hypothetical protein [Croceicoccus sediminis]